DVVGHVRPYAHALVERRYGYKALRRRLTESMMSYSELLETLPRQVGVLRSGLQRNRRTVNLEHRGLGKLTGTIVRAGGHIATVVFIAALIMGAAILILADTVAGNATGGGRGMRSWFGGVTFVVAVVLAGARLVYAWWRG